MLLFRQWAMGPCFYCDQLTYRMGPKVLHPQKYTRDHLIPRRLRGDVITEFRHENWTVTCCQACNGLKGAKRPEVFLALHPAFRTPAKRKTISRAYSLLGKAKLKVQKIRQQNCNKDVAQNSRSLEYGLHWGLSRENVPVAVDVEAQPEAGR